LDKADTAFRTIGELSRELGIAQHILRYWETRFPQLRPLQRAGNRRYYRPADVALARRIDRLLNREGYTVRGVQKLLSARNGAEEPPPAAAGAASRAGSPSAPDAPSSGPALSDRALLAGIAAVRDQLARALAEDEGSAR